MPVARPGNGAAPAEALILPWAQRLIQLHLSLIYFDTSVLKCGGTSWLGGTALHFVLYNREFGRLDLTALCQYPIVINLLTHAALLAEFALAILLWFRPTRKVTALVGVGLHFSIYFMVNAPLFGELMTACYLTFLEPDELDAFLHALVPGAGTSSVDNTARAMVPGRVDAAEPARGPHAIVAVSARQEI